MRYSVLLWALLSFGIGHSQKRIQGIVSDDNSLPMKNVTISVQGTDSMVLTDESGAYSIV